MLSISEAAREITPTPIATRGARQREYDPVRALVAAVIERAVEDIRFLRRHGFLNDDGATIIRAARPKLSAANENGAGAHLAALDALSFFKDGRLERTVNLLNSDLVYADRIKAHVLGRHLPLEKPTPRQPF